MTAFFSSLLVGVLIAPFSLILCWLRLITIQPYKNAKTVWAAGGKVALKKGD
jgi:hypothetical protein